MISKLAHDLQELPSVGAILAVIEGVKNGTILTTLAEEVVLRKIEKVFGDKVGDKVVAYGGKLYTKVKGKIVEIKDTIKKIEITANPSVISANGLGGVKIGVKKNSNGNISTGLLQTTRSKNIKAYLDDVQKTTGRKLGSKQKELLKSDLRDNSYSRLSTSGVKANRKAFDSKRNSLISQWEKETNKKWPTETFVNNKGKIKVRKYDAHHIVENKFGGKNE